MWCEVCGIEADKRRWPTGWTGCGSSNWIFNRDYLKPDTVAHWCPDHPFTPDRRQLTKNEAETMRGWLRRIEREIERDLDAAPVRYSARREGLVEMKGE